MCLPGTTLEWSYRPLRYPGSRRISSSSAVYLVVHCPVTHWRRRAGAFIGIKPRAASRRHKSFHTQVILPARTGPFEMEEKQQDTVAHVEADPEKPSSLRQASVHHQVGDAQLANQNEHNFTVRQALRAYPWALFWTLIVLMSIIMEGTSHPMRHLWHSIPDWRYRLRHNPHWQLHRVSPSFLHVFRPRLLTISTAIQLSSASSVYKSTAITTRSQVHGRSPSEWARQAVALSVLSSMAGRLRDMAFVPSLW